jgi:hypothetical protein
VTAALGTVTSGSKLRFNALALGSAQNWTVTVELSYTSSGWAVSGGADILAVEVFT